MELIERQQMIAEKLHALANEQTCKRVLLINPPQFPSGSIDSGIAKNRRYFAQPPYGLGVLARQLHEGGLQSHILDLNFVALDHLASTKERLQPGDVAIRWKASLGEAIDLFKPDLICLTCMFTTVYENTREVARACRELTEIPVMVGGVAVINDPKGILKDNPAIDFLALYECDDSLCKVIEVMNGSCDPSKLSQIATLVDDAYVALDERKAPAKKTMDAAPLYGDLPLGRYSSVGEIGAYRFWLPEGTKASTVISNRGCRAHCAFCSVNGFCGSGVRARSVSAVVDEIEHLQQVHGITHVMWLDDDLLYDSRRAISMFNEIARRGIKITWDATNGVIAAAITEEIMDAAVSSGCVGLNLGIETGNEKILREMGKPATIRHYQLAAEILKKYPAVFTRGFLIVGFPKETLADVQQTIDFARELALDWYTIQILCPLPASALYQQLAGPVGGKESIDLGNLSFGSSHTGRQRNIEQQEKIHALDFEDLLRGDLQQELEPAMMNDVWFLADYKINYERILGESDTSRLFRWRSLLRDVADRITTENPLANMFLAIIEDKIGTPLDARARRENVARFTADSAYWAKRFEVLGLAKAADETWRKA